MSCQRRCQPRCQRRAFVPPQCRCSAPPSSHCDTSVDHLRVCGDLHVQRRATVGDVCFRAKSPPQHAPKWCVGENDDGDLEFAFDGEPRLTLDAQGGVQMLRASELEVTSQTIYIGPREQAGTYRLRPDPERGVGDVPDNSLVWELRTGPGPNDWEIVGRLFQYVPGTLPIPPS